MLREPRRRASSYELEDRLANQEKQSRPRTPDDRYQHDQEEHESPCSTDTDLSPVTSQVRSDVSRRQSSATARSDKDRSALARLWHEHVNIAVDPHACRDHLGEHLSAI